jgi:DNA-directed RNA polymerase specialized sigma24 family protein
VGPAWLLVAIRSRMSDALAARLEAQDVLQEVLVASWRAWPRYEWRGFRALRSWLLELADHRLRDAAQREGALKRGGGVTIVSLDEQDTTREDRDALTATTTPSKLAAARAGGRDAAGAGRAARGAARRRVPARV